MPSHSRTPDSSLAVPSISIIDRYLIREIGLTFLATVLVLLAMVLSHRLAGYLSKAASGLLARDSIFLLIGLQADRKSVV